MPEQNKTRLNVEGMTCANCAAGITRHLTKKGYHSVATNFATGEVVFDTVEKAALDKAVDEINSLGYKVVKDHVKEERKKGLSSIEMKFYFTLIFTLPLLAHMFSNIHILHDHRFQLALSIPVVVIGLLHFGKSAIGSIKAGMANMDVLIVTGSTSAFIYSCVRMISGGQVFFETSASIITFVLLGNLIEHYSVKRTTSAIEDLTRLQPEKASLVSVHDGHEHVTKVDTAVLKKDDLIRVNNGDSIPVDAIVTGGACAVNEAMITGEPLPVTKKEGDLVKAGTILVNGSITAKAISGVNDSSLAQIIELVKRAQEEKPPIQRLGDKVSAVFVPVVLGISLITFICWKLIAGASTETALMNSIAVLVISCPCAMGLATPTAVMVGIGRAARNGILLKGGNTIERMADVKTVVFDKTGTLTTGKFEVKAINAEEGESIDSVRSVISSLESRSSHPIAVSLSEHLKNYTHQNILIRTEEVKGEGMKGTDQQGHEYFLGSFRTVKDFVRDDSHTLYLSRDRKLIATIDIADSIREGAADSISALHDSGIHTVMLSGDRRRNCEAIAGKLKIEEVHAEMLPADKNNMIKDLRTKQTVAMVGDGINDAAALSSADIGISISDSSKVAMNASQVIMLNSGKELNNISGGILLSKRIIKTIKQNLFWAFVYNIVAIPVAAFGFLDVYGPIIGALSMAFSDVVVIGNSLRLRFIKVANLK